MTHQQKKKIHLECFKKLPSLSAEYMQDFPPCLIGNMHLNSLFQFNYSRERYLEKCLLSFV